MRHCNRSVQQQSDTDLDLKTFMDHHDIPVIILHDRLAKLFSDFGSTVLFVEQSPLCDLWTISVHLNGRDHISCTSRATAREINRYLREHGIKLDAGSPTLSRQGSEIRIHFTHKGGDPGVGRRYLRLRHGELREEFSTYSLPPGW